MGSTEQKPARYYGLYDGDQKPPSFERVVRGLSNSELLDEVVNERGDADYQTAVKSELGRRGLRV